MAAVNPDKRAHRFEYLDILRLLCATAVMIFHYLVISPFTKLTPSELLTAPHLLVYGQLGVEIFFMISGFVITLSSHGRTVRQFLWARFLRLYPAYWLCCIITAFLIVMIGTGDRSLWKPDWAGFLVNMTMMSGFVRIPYVDLVYWSLKPELQFYAMVAFCLFFRIRVDSNRVMAGWLVFCITSPFLPSFVGKVVMADFAPFFIFGILLQSLLDRRQWAVKITMMAVAMVLASRTVLEQAADFTAHGLPPIDPVAAVVVTLAGACLVIASAFLRAPEGTRKWMMTAGAITYPLYLIHNVAGALVTVSVASLGSVWLGLAAAVIFSFAVAALIALKLEPFLRAQLRRLEAPVGRVAARQWAVVSEIFR